MNTHIQETARQILGEVSDIQAELSFSGSAEMNLKLAAIREKAAFLLEGDKGVEKIIIGYQIEAQDSLLMLAEEIRQYCDGGKTMNDTGLIKASLMCGVFFTRCNVYLNRKARAMVEETDVS